jgi:Ca-activated chloride channel homolog
VGGRRVGRITRAVILVAAAVCALAQDVVFRTDVSLVRLLVSVRDGNGTPVALTQNSFKIHDNGVEQQIALFERYTSQPLSVAILLDTSGSTAKEIKYEIDSVTRFTRTLFAEGNPDDRAALFTFNWEIVKRTAFTHSAQQIERSMRGIKSEGGTSLYDAIWLACREIEDREGRHVLIVVTDGGDTTSSHTYHQALEAAHRADAVIYPILVVPITNEAGRNVGGENALTGLAQSTGGRVFAPSIGAELDQAFADILTELRTQYLIGYYPRNIPPTKDRFHRVKVEVDKPGLRVQSRTGYYESSGR